MINKALYQQQLLDHYRYPRNARKLDTADIETAAFNPSCGDKVAFQAIVENSAIKLLVFQGEGCVISQATASLLTQLASNKDLDQLQNLTSKDIMQLIGIELGPNRARCALLSLEALLAGIKEYKNNIKKE